MTQHESQLFVYLREIGRVCFCPALGHAQLPKCLFLASLCEQGDTLEHIAQFVVRLQTGIAVEVFKCLFPVAQRKERIGLVEECIRIGRVDGYRELAAFDGVSIVVFQKLRRGQLVPVVRGVGILVEQFVVDALAVLGVALAEGDACREILIVGVGFVGPRSLEPLVSEREEFVVGKERGHIKTEVDLFFLVVEHGILFREKPVGLFFPLLEDHYLSRHVNVVRVVRFIHPVDESACLFCVLLFDQCDAGTKHQRQRGPRKEFESIVYRTKGLVEPPFGMIVFRDVSQVVRFEVDTFSCRPALFVAPEHLLELTGVEIFVCPHVFLSLRMLPEG